MCHCACDGGMRANGCVLWLCSVSWITYAAGMVVKIGCSLSNSLAGLPLHMLLKAMQLQWLVARLAGKGCPFRWQSLKSVIVVWSFRA